MSEQTVSSSLPTPDQTVVVDESVAKTAQRIAKTKTFLKNSFENVGRPAIAGAAGAALLLVLLARNVEDGKIDLNTDTDTTE